MVYEKFRLCYACALWRALPSEESAEMHADMITSRDNKWLKAFRAALQGPGPKEGEPIGVEGRKLVEDALASGLEVEALLVSESSEGELEHIVAAAAQSERGLPGKRVFRTKDKLFASVSGTEAPQG